MRTTSKLLTATYRFGGLLFLFLLSETNLFAVEKLILTGSSTVAPLMSVIGKRFESSHPSIRVDVQTGGSSRGIADTRQGLANIGMVSRSLSSNEHDLKFFTIARDGICLIVNKANMIKELSDQQIIDIYTGKIKNWSEVGGKKAPITVVNKADGRSTLELFLKYFSLKSSSIKAHVVIGDNEQGLKTVAGDPNAIGYVSIGAAEYSHTHKAPIKLLPISGVAASIKNVENGSFPLSRPLNLVTKALPKGLEKNFITFARSKEVSDLIRRQYFVPVAN
ncbi:MAG: phosphate ABC transporter substrate-binding protein [Bdellovibrionota bacterium]